MVLHKISYCKEMLEKYDTGGMHRIYDSWPEIARKQYEESDQASLSFDKDSIDHVVFSGMGGSGAISDIFSSILSKSKIHVCTIKGYLLPKTVDSNTLVVTTSVSGNTVETLSVLKSAVEKKSKIIAFSNGGKIKEFCTNNGLEYREIPMYNSPRASFVPFLYSMLKTLGPVMPIDSSDVVESLVHLERMRDLIGSSKIYDVKNASAAVYGKSVVEQDGYPHKNINPALELARWIRGIPMVYYPAGLEAGATRIKNCLQENAKMHAMGEDILEASHSGIVAWENKTQNVQPILLRGQDDYFKTKERWDIVKEYFEKNNIDYKEIVSVRGSILSKLSCMIYLLDYSTIYKATMLGVDPSPVRPIDFVKQQL